MLSMRLGVTALCSQRHVTACLSDAPTVLPALDRSHASSSDISPMRSVLFASSSPTRDPPARETTRRGAETTSAACPASAAGSCMTGAETCID